MFSPNLATPPPYPDGHAPAAVLRGRAHARAAFCRPQVVHAASSECQTHLPRPKFCRRVIGCSTPIRTMSDGPTEAAGRPIAHACGPEGPPPAPLISKRPGRRARCERCARKLRKLPKLTRKLPKLTLSKLHRRSGPLGLNAASTLPVRRPRPTLSYLPLQSRMPASVPLLTAPCFLVP